MANQPRTYRFGDYTLNAGEHCLLRNGAEVALRPKAFDTLVYLVARHGHTVGKNEAFLQAVPEHHPSSAIAVLPFANLSSDPENEYFCDGLSEELINGLTKVPALRVVAHSSSLSFKGGDTDAREIGRQFGVGWVLEGSVRKAGDHLRISARLIATSGGFHVWCEQYDRTMKDVFALQDEISRSVLAALKVELLKGPRPAMIRPSTGSMEAYLLYLQGRSFWHRRFGGQIQRAIECFEQAIQKDPGFALAYSGLADSFGSLGVWAFVPPRDAFPRAMALARRAVELDPALAEGHASMGLLHMFDDWDWLAAERDLARAIELNPGSALTHLYAGHFLTVVGRFDEALAEVLHAQALDPLSFSLNANVGWTFYLAGQHDRAIDELQVVLARAPGNPMVLLYLGFALAAAGRLVDAIPCLRESAATPGGMPWAAESAGWAYGLSGDHVRARAVLDESLARMQTSYVPASGIACIHLGLGDDDALFEWLGRSVEERDALLPWLKFMPAFDRVRPDPLFQALLARIGLG